MPTVTLTWNDLNAGDLQEDEIRVYRDEVAFDATTLPAILATLPADSETYVDATVSLSTSYWYAVAMVKGSLVEISFTGEVAVAAGASDPFWANVSLLCHFDGADGSASFVDETGKTITAVGSAQVDTAQSVFGGASGLFDGSGDFLTLADDPAWSFGDGPFTIELFVRHSTKNDTTTYVTQWNDGWAFYIEGGQLKMRVIFFGGSLSDFVYTWAPTLGQWYHVCVERNAAGLARFYIDGVMVASDPSAIGGLLRDSGSGLAIGAIGTLGLFPAYDFSGHMDELRITKGVARYNSNAGFTVPIEAFPDF